jgi:pyridoxal phosphate enzyme (YggS family)
VGGEPGSVAANVATTLERIAEAARRAGRSPSSVTLVGAAKGVAPAVMQEAVRAGVRAIGHNYVKELRAAREALASADVTWHYIGALQSGTANAVADMADVVETVAGERAARRLGGRATRGGRTLDVLLEIDFTARRTGLAPGELADAASVIASIEGLRVRGLMTVPPVTADAEGARPWFAKLRELRDGLVQRYPDMLELSMGMSLDYQVAVEEGATMVRVGTALFGPRAP